MLRSMIVGFVVGALAGILFPMSLAVFYSMTEPGFEQGGATPFAIFTTCTVPVGMGLGVIIGAMVGANK